MHDEDAENGAEKEKSSSKYKKIVEEYLSQYLHEENQLLYQKDEYNRLNDHYHTIRADLYDQKRYVSKLNQDYDEANKNWKKQEKLTENLEKENIILKNRIESFKTRKIVRLTDMILNIIKGKGSKQVQTDNTEPHMTHEVKDVKTPEQSAQLASYKEETSTDMSKPKYLKDIKVAIIMDEFSYNSFKYEFNALELEPDNWREIFETEKPDLFLCESAWHGINPITKPWSRKISTNKNSKKENRKELLEILDYCREHNIPSIFWNKEDPTHYHNEVSSFTDTASKFDHIFTSAEECINNYITEFGHESVHSLMFAAQPRLFNPIKEGERTEDVIFAGSWYAHHPRRCDEMRNIFEKVLEAGYKLKIYDRTFYSKLDDSYNFPDEYIDYVNPAVSHDQMARVYKESKYAININTVTDSNTMFARRAFELILCNTLVISNHSKGLEKLFKNNIIFLDKKPLNLEHNLEKRLKNLYNVLENHTYTNRFKQILDNINYPYQEKNKTVTLYYQTETPEETEKAIEHFQTMDYPHKNAIILNSYNDPEAEPNPYSTEKNQEITIKPINNCEELINLKNSTPYFIFVNTNLKPDFIRKAILHYMYIETKYGIAEGNNFRFKNTKNAINTLFNNEEFEKTLKKQNNKQQQQEIPIYTIKT